MPPRKSGGSVARRSGRPTAEPKRAPGRRCAPPGVSIWRLRRAAFRPIHQNARLGGDRIQKSANTDGAHMPHLYPIFPRPPKIFSYKGRNTIGRQNRRAQTAAEANGRLAHHNEARNSHYADTMFAGALFRAFWNSYVKDPAPPRIYHAAKRFTYGANEDAAPRGVGRYRARMCQTGHAIFRAPCVPLASSGRQKPPPPLAVYGRGGDLANRNTERSEKRPGARKPGGTFYLRLLSFFFHGAAGRRGNLAAAAPTAS